MEFKKLLKILAREGYPNPRLGNIFDAIDYNPEEFLHDLVEELGVNGAEDFVGRALGKLSKQGQDYYLIKVPLEGYSNSWIEIEIYNFIYEPEESDTDVVVNYGWGNSRIETPEGVKTLEDISDEADMGEWGDYQDFLDEIRSEVYNYISTRTGFGIWYQ